MYLTGKFMIEFDPELIPCLHFDGFGAGRDDALKDEFRDLISARSGDQMFFNVLEGLDRWRCNWGANVSSKATNDRLEGS